MSSKRSHSKSRTGCKQCKARRIKCDEVPPCCGNCAKKGLVCEYRDFRDAFESIRLLTPASFGADPERSSQASSSASLSAMNVLNPLPEYPASIPGPASSYAGFTSEDLGLMHTYTVSTCETLSVIDSDDQIRIWRYVVPTIAVEHQFLLHALLGIAAAHQHASSETGKQTLRVARQHYGQALRLFLNLMGNVGAEHFDSLLCFSVVLSMLTLYLDCQRSPEQEDAISDFQSLLQTLHSATGVLQQFRPSSQPSEVSGLLSHLQVETSNEIGVELGYWLEQLDHLFGEYTKRNPESVANETAILKESIQALGRFFVLCSTRPTSWAFILWWPNSLPREFTELVQRRHPVALCITAYWCVPFWHAPVKWYCGAWPTRLLLAISWSLENSEWYYGLAWPLRETIGPY